MGKLIFASVISEIQQSEVFMTVKARICEAPAANLNGARVTEAFIDEIVDNEDRYVGLPLNADVKALTSGKYNRLGHLYDSRTGEFHSTQIGSFYQFQKETFDGGCYLVGYARIPKRNKKISKAISEMFADGKLKFSFELTAGEYEELDDGTILIDASENNYLEGTAIVTYPACEEAVALQLVAQQTADAPEGGETEMADETNQAVETIKEIAEQVDTAVAEMDISETAQEIQENAEVVVVRNHYESDTVSAFDTETGAEVHQAVSVDTTVRTVEEGEIVNVNDEIASADTVTAEEAETTGTVETVDTAETVQESESSDESGEQNPEPVAEEVVEEAVNNADSNKKTAEQLIAELTAVVENLKAEIEELKTQRVNAEAKTVTAEINQMMEDINSERTFSLLETPRRERKTFTLI